MNLEQQQHARNLFFQSDMTQAQIAELVGVTQKTISIWANEGRWQKLKELAVTTPAVIIEEIYNELSEINLAIRARDVGNRFATPQEADTRRKLLASIRYIKEQQSASSHMEVLINFTEFLKYYQPTLVKDVVLAADSYLRGEKRLGLKQKFTPYDLPTAEPETPQHEAPQQIEIKETPTQPQATPTKKAEKKTRRPRNQEEREIEAWHQYIHKIQNNLPD